jgi:hypothetical protein
MRHGVARETHDLRSPHSVACWAVPKETFVAEHPNAIRHRTERTGRRMHKAHSKLQFQNLSLLHRQQLNPINDHMPIRLRIAHA